MIMGARAQRQSKEEAMGYLFGSERATDHVFMPYGKYQSQPILLLQHDIGYAKWLLSTEYFAGRYAAIARIVEDIVKQQEQRHRACEQDKVDALHDHAAEIHSCSARPGMPVPSYASRSAVCSTGSMMPAPVSRVASSGSRPCSRSRTRPKAISGCCRHISMSSRCCGGCATFLP
jgi:hypothetical protein